MANEMTELKIDMGLIAHYGNADYIDGDMVVLDGIDKVLQVDGTFKFDMIMMVYCTKGRIQFETNSNPYTAKAGDVIICLPNSTWENVMVSPDYDSKSVGVSSKAAQASVQVNRDYLTLLGYVSHNPVIHLNEERQQMFLKYYAIIAHKIKNPHGFYHKEIMHCLLQSSIYELFAIITPYVEYSIEGGNLKQANLLFQRFIEMLSANNGRMQPVKKYAQELCITPKYLSNITKQVTGRTALDWIHSYTVKAIEKYLRRSNLSIKEISELLGFPNLSFFGKFTKSHLGMSPTQYRKEQSMRK
ncbi:helix-turn-helix domain-containing protein [Leyella stercorea]|uniref:helix-turn-helix domain-containing protein n=1 Tax=Leyella stercorea TaxID=363265 RepID=UPI004026A43B